MLFFLSHFESAEGASVLPLPLQDASVMAPPPARARQTDAAADDDALIAFLEEPKPLADA